MRLTSKGQVTIPKAVRDKLGIKPGGNVGFEEEGDKIVLVNEEAKAVEDAAERMIRHMVEFGRKAKRIPMTDKELMELTRGPFNDLDAD
ncbi:MAG: AbrB/MazE/SpoVT family DNA-binding domain-containing protein [Rhizobiales bacterium]|nr:AbrB/MazE/SpoVT family DNA-binding domain-containing protein [Hyphomicrobiales bacterium]